MESRFHHALKIQTEVCTGCSRCMMSCPTQAIRVRKGKAVLLDERCVDCGECYRVCPVGAIIIEQDDFNRIFEYRCRVALLPAVMIGQVPDSIPAQQIFSVLLELGFTHVFEVEKGVSLLHQAILDHQRQQGIAKPLISSFCPAIIRLIQVKFPALVDHILPLKPPLEVAALNIRRQLSVDGLADHQIGIFYVTPCAAKIASVKSPADGNPSPINGIINMNYLYNKVLRKAIQGNDESCMLPDHSMVAPADLIWSLTKGESSRVAGRAVAVDGIHHVISFLERVENDEMDDVDYLELRACDESCAGGVLLTGDRFLTVERLHNHMQELSARDIPDTAAKDTWHAFQDEIGGQLGINRIEPRPVQQLSSDRTIAMEKLQRIRELMKILPGVDCGACGTPDCQTLAEDIVRDMGSVNQCIFIQRRFEEQGIMDASESIQIMKSIWGDEKIKG
ncbi:MAG: 4Fe-4S binding protein [Lentimicrobiaceae bacterium]|nr:4Fe-4S binding protein [Lentimicrobiaceae bacterium]